MRFATHNQILLPDLQAMADGLLEDTISDGDFLETLARRKCILVPPWIVQTSPSGRMTQVTPLIYDEDGNLDKPRLLVAVARFVAAQRRRLWFRRRLHN